MQFKVGDICNFVDPDNSSETLAVEVIGEEACDPDELVYCDFPVFQVLAVKYRVSNGRIGVALCTESEIVTLLPGCSAISFDDVISVIRNGVDVKLAA